MPYIKQEERDHSGIIVGIGLKCKNAGDLNYAFSEIIAGYLKARGLKYQHLNDAIGALEGCKLELYRRVVGPYEDTKIAENGDINLGEFAGKTSEAY
jgi:hypothetical protein